MSTFKQNNLTLHHRDALSLLSQLPGHSIDLIATDPPYYKFKKEAWDHQWKTKAEFFEWLNLILAEYARVLKPNGSLYLFAGPHLATEVDMTTRKHFNVLNQIIWCKSEGRHLACRKESLRKYFPQTEHIIFAETRQLSDQRRPFKVTKQVPYTNVWQFNPVRWYRGKHPCEKPLELMKHIISTSSHPGDKVLDTFVGSGSTAIACQQLNRSFIGCELGADEYAQAVKRISLNQ